MPFTPHLDLRAKARRAGSNQRGTGLSTSPYLTTLASPAEFGQHDPMRLIIMLLLCASPSLAAEPAAITKAPPAGGIIAAGSITAADMSATLARGPQQFIAELTVRPVMEGRRFHGFELLKIAPASPLAGTVHLRPGDVIVSVNGASVERPDQFMKLWEALPKASHVDLKLRRAGHAMTYRWTVEK